MAVLGAAGSGTAALGADGPLDTSVLDASSVAVGLETAAARHT